MIKAELLIDFDGVDSKKFISVIEDFNDGSIDFDELSSKKKTEIICEYANNNVDTLINLVIDLVKVSNLISVVVSGCIYKSLTTERMDFLIEFNSGKLQYSFSDWCLVYTKKDFTEYSDFCDVTSVYGKVLLSEEDFKSLDDFSIYINECDNQIALEPFGLNHIESIDYLSTYHSSCFFCRNKLGEKYCIDTVGNRYHIECAIENKVEFNLILD